MLNNGSPKIWLTCYTLSRWKIVEVEEVRILDPIKNCAKVMIFQLLAALDHVGNLTVSLNIPSLRRAQGLLECGVDGIEVCESEIQALCSPQRWLSPFLAT